MCGINVVLKYDHVAEHDRCRISLMNEAMQYRGPDDDDIWADNKAVLGMRRLSIVGVDNGHQPIFSENKEIVLVCNGEIYNHLELRVLLEKAGHHFISASDCEVIVHLYEEYGENCVEFLRGMFAFVIWDTRKKQLFAARDRLGEKPLYYMEFPLGIVFSSELNTIRKFWLNDAEPDLDIIREIYTYGHSIDKYRTFVKKIYRVSPGESVRVDENGPHFKYYWKPIFATTFHGTKEQALEQLKHLVEESIQMRLLSDVSVAVLLSGGIDSSLIAHLAARKSKELTAITAGYLGNHDCDERKVARKFAEKLGIPWLGVELNLNDFANYFEEFIGKLDEPVADVSSFAQWGIYHKAAELGFKVLLSGVGGDELFFGYPSHNREGYREDIRHKISAYLPLTGGRSAIAFGKHLLSHINLWPGLAELILHDPNFSPNKKLGNTHPFFSHKTQVFKSVSVSHTMFEAEVENGYDQVYAGLIGGWLWANCLHLGDKLGMGASVEVRCPFVDHKLLEFVFSLPIEWRLSLNKPKQLIRLAYSNELPTDILNGQKRGFTPPRDFVNDLVQRERTVVPEVTNYTSMVIRRMVSEYFGETSVDVPEITNYTTKAGRRKVNQHFRETSCK